MARDEKEFRDTLRKQLKEKWGKLSDEDLFEISHDMTKLIEKLRIAYERPGDDFEVEIAEFQFSRAN